MDDEVSGGRQVMGGEKLIDRGARMGRSRDFQREARLGNGDSQGPKETADGIGFMSKRAFTIVFHGVG